MKDSDRITKLEAQIADLVRMPEYQQMLERRLADVLRAKDAARREAARPKPVIRKFFKVALVGLGVRDVESYGARDPRGHIYEPMIQLPRGGFAALFGKTIQKLREVDPVFVEHIDAGTIVVTPCTDEENAHWEHIQSSSDRLAGSNPSLGFSY